MANKYCNLDGNKKIKDEYQKINIGFDKVEEDVNKINDDINTLDERVDTIITTPVEDVSAEEIIDARGGNPTLGKRFENIETAIEELDGEDIKYDNTESGLSAENVQSAIDEVKDELDEHKADYASDLNSRLNGVYKVGRKHFNILNTPSKNIRTNVFKIVTDINSGYSTGFLLKVTGQENTGKPIMFLIRIYANNFSYCKYSSINQETPEIKISKENNNVVLWFNHVGNYIQYTFDLLYHPASYVNNVDWKVYEVDVSEIPAEAVSIPLYE